MALSPYFDDSKIGDLPVFLSWGIGDLSTAQTLRDVELSVKCQNMNKVNHRKLGHQVK